MLFSWAISGLSIMDENFLLFEGYKGGEKSSNGHWDIPK